MKQTAMNQAQERQNYLKISKYNPKNLIIEIYVDIEEIANKNKEK